MQRTFVAYNDPGHAWAKIPAASILAVGLKAADFTGYSYVGRDCLYLEEDADLGVFVKAFEAKTGERPKWNERHCDNRSNIRNKHNNNPAAVRYFAPSLA